MVKENEPRVPALLRDGARIDFLCNANNYPLALVRALRKIGFDAHLHLFLNVALNAPENRYPAYAGSYPEWIHDWRDPGVEVFQWDASWESMRAEAAKADALVLNHVAVNLGAEEKRPYFCLLTGTDLLTYANPVVLKEQFIPDQRYDLEYFPNRYLACNWIELCLRQRAAIRGASGYSFFPRGLLPVADTLLAGIGADRTRQLSFLFSEIDDLEYSPPLRQEPLNILISARLTWDKGSQPQATELDYKGTDIALRGIARFIHQGGKVRLHLFRKGMHISQTEGLIQELGIMPNTCWHEELSQREFLGAIKGADIVVDTIGNSHIGMAVCDAMSIGRPVIATAPDWKLWGWPGPLPIFDARTEDDVAKYLKQLVTQDGLGAAMAKKARECAEAYFSPIKAAERIVHALRQPRFAQEWELYERLRMYRRLDEDDYNRHVASADVSPSLEQRTKPTISVAAKNFVKKFLRARRRF